MKKISIDNLIDGLRQIPAENFICGTIYNFLKENRVDVDSLEPYLFFNKENYTRNLIFKNELFEVMAVCWEVGQASLIHDHADQSCWMAMPIGRLQIKNFRLLESNPETNRCKIELIESFELTGDCAAEVELEDPLHQVLNLRKFGQRAVSLHVYSKPFDRCKVYSLGRNEMSERKMCYTSMYGKLVPVSKH
jgi:cysteine dioxygenase